MHNAVEIMDGCEYSIKIIIVPLKERMEPVYVGDEHTTAERITLTKNDCKFSCQNKYSTFLRMDDCHSFYDKNRYSNYFKGWMTAIRVVKKIDYP